MTDTDDLAGLVVVGAKITYMLAHDRETGRPVARGRRPHCPPYYRVPGAKQCPADITVTSGTETIREQCTREARHSGPHVVLAAPGLPTLAWLLDPSTPAKRATPDTPAKHNI